MPANSRQDAQPLRCRILARIRRFFWPFFRRPFPDFFTPIDSASTRFFGTVLMTPPTGQRPIHAAGNNLVLDCSEIALQGLHPPSARSSPGGITVMIAFFPTYARRINPTGGWRITISGMVSHPLPDPSRRRRVARAVVKRLLKLDDAQLESAIFRARSELFLFQRVAGQPVRIRIGDQTVAVGISDRVGHFTGSFDLDEAVVAEHASPTPCGRRLAFAAVADPEDLSLGEPAEGQVHLLDGEGLSVISDIDDTVKVTNVADRRELLANTLLREFTAIPDMVDLYRTWSDQGLAFHYVSASPWQLSATLRHFFLTAGLPDGSMHLKLFRLKDSTPLGRIRSKRSKRAAIVQILDHFPRRRFILVGDSGERDPEVYAAVARQRPQQVAAVAIRRVPSRQPPLKVEAGLQKLTRVLPAEQVRVFQTAPELAELLAAAQQ